MITTLDEVEHIALHVDSILYNRDSGRNDFKSRSPGVVSRNGSNIFGANQIFPQKIQIK